MIKYIDILNWDVNYIDKYLKDRDVSPLDVINIESYCGADTLRVWYRENNEND